MASADRDAFTGFTTDLAAALRARLPGAHVSLAMPSVNWNQTYDYVGLAAVADALIIMGYDYHWTGSDPGPVAPLTSGALWTSYDVTWSVNDYLKKVAADKVWLAVPLYGYDYPSVDGSVPGSATGSATSITYAKTELYTGAQWDVASQTPYFIEDRSDGWHQVWYDDARSLGLKFDLVNQQQLGGIGIWALGYEGSSGTFWDQVASHFLGPDLPPDAGVADRPDAGAVTSETGDVTGACGCRVAAPAPAPVAALIPLLICSLRRRRSASRRRACRCRGRGGCCATTPPGRCRG
jgi:spore germination protein YaaH